MYEDSPIPGMHPRQAEVLLQVAPEARQAVINRAHLLMNLQGGVFSSCLWAAKRDLERLGGDLEAIEALDRRDNHAAMASCARSGCSACAKSVS